MGPDALLATGVWEPQDPGYEEFIRSVFASHAAMVTIGAELGRVEPGFVELHMPCAEHVTQHYGMVHGGVVGMLADEAAALAALTMAKRGRTGLTVEYKISLLAPATGERLIARGRLVRPGRPLSVAAADVYAASDGHETLVATALGTMVGGRR